MSSYWPFIVPGLVNGAIYALAAVGLVLTYKTTGTFNLAFGAQAYVSAVVYYELRNTHGWGLVPGLIIAVVVVGPALGLTLDRLVFRYLRRAPVMTRLAVGIGLLIAIPGMVTIATSIVGGDQTRLAPPSVGPDRLRFYRWGSLNIDSDQLIVLIATAIVVVLLVIVVRYTALGLRMRAVVESARMSELSGTNAGRVNTLAWVISSFIAGLTGVLLAPLFATVNGNQFTFLVVAAISAATFGGLTSIPLAVVGGLVLGVSQGLLVKWLPLGSVLAQGLRPSLPFVMLLVLLVLRRGLSQSGRPGDPLAGVDPPPRVAGGGQVREMALWAKLALTGLGAVVSSFLFSDYWIGIGSRALIFSTIFLSLTLLTGMSGHISLCQASFVGIGAFVAGQLAVEQEMSLFVGMLIGGIVAAVGGAMLAVLALRLGGLYLALATLAFGFLADNVIFVQSWALGDIRGLDVPRPLLGPIDFTSNTSFFFLTAVVFALALVLMHAIRRGATGQLLTSLRGSEPGAQSIGVDPTPIKIKVFALSAGVAGVAGGLLGSQQGAVSTVNFISFQSLYWMVVVLAVGVYTIRGAVAAGFLLVFLPELLSHLPTPYLALQFVVFGLGVINLARHPEGALDYLLFVPERVRERRRK